MGKPSGRDRFDWPAIKREYSTAQFTDAELCRRHGCSRQSLYKKIKEGEWARDNSSEVRRVAQAKLIKEDARSARELVGMLTPPADKLTTDNIRETECQPPDDELEQRDIELAAETRVAVLRSHRKDLSKLRLIEETLAARLLTGKITKVFSYKGEIISQDFDICDTDLCMAYNQLTGASHKRQMLERLAFNLDDKRSEDDALPTVIIHDPGYGAYVEGGPEDPLNQQDEDE